MSRIGGHLSCLGLALLAGSLLTLPAGTALGASSLTMESASQRSHEFARSTCDQDENCVGFGVLNCNRQRNRVVLCRIYDDRRTEAQGRYRCDRLIRLALDPRTGRTPVTGLGRWHC